jgi:hypothetical protein
MTLINRSESIYWEFMALQGTEHWRSYIKTTCEIGLSVMLFIQVVHKVGSSSQVHEEGSAAHQGEAELQTGDGPATEPQEVDGASTEAGEGDGDTPFEARGEIDEGKVSEEVLRQYEMKTNEDERGLEEDSSDDKDDPLVPRDWDSYNFSQLAVNPGENVSSEYRDNKVSVGAMYNSAVAVKDAVKRWATLPLQREYRVVKSSPHIYDVQCLKPNCPFQVYASKGKWKNYWEIIFVVDHTCVLEQLDASHRNLSASFVVSQMFAKIVENPAYEPKSIILAIEEKFRYQKSYGKAYIAKKKVLEMSGVLTKHPTTICLDC